MDWKACKIGKVRKIFLQTGICGGKPDERKDLSNSLRNDSLLDKLVDELAKGKAMEKIKRTNK